jgi:preprotein translocase subunit YajC
MRTKLAVFLLLTATCVWAQAPEGHGPQGSGPQGGPGTQMQMRGGTAGTITEIKDNALTIKQVNGESATVNLSDKTEYRKERQPAKLADLKLGDAVMVRGERAGDAWNAQAVSVVPPEMMQRFGQGPGPGGPGAGGPGGGMMMMREGLGKEFIAGEITAIDETKLTIKRVDGETQTIELDETSSLRRRGGVSITLPDVRVGEQVFGRGKLKDGVFVPEVLTVGEFPQMRMMMGGQEPPKKPEEKH